MRVRKVVSDLERKSCQYRCEKPRKHLCVTNRHDMTLAVKTALNPKEKINIVYRYTLSRHIDIYLFFFKSNHLRFLFKSNHLPSHRLSNAQLNDIKVRPV